MITFDKEVEMLLPYDRDQYLDFLEDDSILLVKWYGLSFQINGNDEHISLIEYIDSYEYFVKELISNLNNNSNWIVNLEDKNFKWFPNDENNLCDLRSLFRKNKISLEYTGGAVFSNEDLQQYVKDLILYPYVLLDKPGKLYRNINISHSILPFVIRTTGHLDIDILCTDINVLKYFNDSYSQHPFIIKRYRGTSF